MSAITIKIECGNDAFYPDPVPEINRILSRIQKDLESGSTANKLYDENGNLVGSFELNLPDTDDDYYGSPAHQEMGDEWYYRDCPGAW